MRAGKLDRVIIIQGYAAGTPDEYGNSEPTFTPFDIMRAQLVQASTDEFLKGAGELSQSVLVFRTRWLDALTTKHRIQYNGRSFNIREIKEIGRREGLELRCEEVAA